jgi:hypothetical protein
MLNKVLLLTLALASSLTMPLNALAKPRLIEGSFAKENICTVNSEIRWNTDLSQALEQARRENKMVLWIQMIGQMSGST